MEPTWSEGEWAWDPVALTAATAAPCKACPPTAAGTFNKQSGTTLKQSSCRPAHRPKCQVAGCTSDLSQSRAYYRRYRICEEHFRQPSMVLNEQVVRFCQQCAKFEALCEFEGNKRSCRRQLNRHNERRKGRKQRTKGDGGPAADSGAENSDDSCTAQRAHSKPLDQSLTKAYSTTHLPCSAEAAAAAATAAAGATLGVGRQCTLPLTAFQQQLLAHDLMEMVAMATSSADLLPTSPPVTTPAAAMTAAAVSAGVGAAVNPTHFQQEQEQQKQGTPVPSLSDATVQVSQTAGDDNTAGQQDLDAVLVAAAQELLATWQQEDSGTDDMGAAMHCDLPALSQQEAEGSSHPTPRTQQVLGCADRNKDAQVQGYNGVHRQGHTKKEPGSADSSVHGPAAPPPVVDVEDLHTSRVLGLLGQSQYFDPVRADQGPLVQAAASKQPASPCHGVTVPSRSQLLPSPFAAASLGATNLGTSPPHMSEALLPSINGNNSGFGGVLGQHGFGAADAVTDIPPPMMPIGGNQTGMLPWTQATAQHAQHGIHNSSFGGSYTADLLGSSSGTDILDAVPPHWQMPPRSVYPDMATQHGGLGSAARPAVAMHPLLANLQPMGGAHMPPGSHGSTHYPNMFGHQSAGWQATAGAVGGVGAYNSTQDLQSMLGRKLGQANYLLAELSLTRLSIKLHGVTPEALPTDLRAALTEWLANTDVRLLQGFIRPGCVHLSLDCLQMKPKGAAMAMTALSAASSSSAGSHRHDMPQAATTSCLDHLLQHGLGGAHAAASLPRPLAGLFGSCTIVELQSPNRLVLMEGEAVWSTTQLDKRPNLPTIHSAQPLVLLAGSSSPQVLHVSGEHLEGSRSTASSSSTATPQLLIRHSGKFIQTTVQRAAASPAGGDMAGMQSRQQSSSWVVGVDGDQLQPGLAVAECQNGRLLSNWMPVLIVDDVGVQQELLQLQPLQAVLPERVRFLVTGLALLLQARSMHAAAQQQQQREMARTHTRMTGMVDQDSAFSEADDMLDDDDDDALTAPSVSEPDEDYMYDADDESMDDDIAHDILMMDAPHLPPHGVASAPMRVAGVPSHAPRLMSWDSDTFGDAMVHSSWGSNMTSTILAGSGHTDVARDAEMASATPRALGTRAHSSFGTVGAAVQQVNVLPPPGGARPAASRHVSLPDTSSAAQQGMFAPEVCAGLAGKALKLLAFACDAGWPCTTRLLVDILTNLPLVPTQKEGMPGNAKSMACMATQAVLSSTIGPDGLTPLHRAARSGSAATVRELLLAAASAGLQVNPAARGGAAVSPLHCAGQVAGEVGPAAALLLLSSSPGAALQWFVARSTEGKTPAQLCVHPSVQSYAFHMVQGLASQYVGVN